MKKGMSKKQLNQIKLKARQDYLLGESKYEIAKKYSIRKATIVKWAKEDKWDEAREKAIKQAEQQADWHVTEELGRTMKLIKAAEAIYAEELQKARNEGTGLPKSTSMMASLMKEKREIIRPDKTTMNFLRQDNFNLILNQEQINRIEKALEKYGDY